jgi:hypothetical protein
VSADVNGFGPDLSGLDASPEELDALDEVIAEVEAEEAAGMLDDDGELPPEGPWQDAYGPGPTIEGLSAMLDASAESEQLRQAYEDVSLPRTAEERFALALGRIAEGSYTPGAMYRPPEPSHGCGTLDEYGRCSARYHTSPTCLQADAAAAAVGGGEATGAWNAALLRNQETAEVLGVAREVMDELDAPGDPDGTWALREQLGLS